MPLPAPLPPFCRRRRPIALKSGGIGVWDNVLEVMSVVAVITNCALIGVTSERWWPADVSRATRILVVVVAEHVILFLKVRTRERRVAFLPPAWFWLVQMCAPRKHVQNVLFFIFYFLSTAVRRRLWFFAKSETAVFGRGPWSPQAKA